MAKKLSKELAQQMLSNVPDDKIFWLSSGEIIKSMQELKEKLVEMNNETFSTHVNKEKNDFSNWIENVINDKKLANDLKRCKTPTTAAKKVSQRISYLSKKIK